MRAASPGPKGRQLTRAVAGIIPVEEREGNNTTVDGNEEFKRDFIPLWLNQRWKRECVCLYVCMTETEE